MLADAAAGSCKDCGVGTTQQVTKSVDAMVNRGPVRMGAKLKLASNLELVVRKTRNICCKGTCIYITNQSIF